ncbi:MAG: hypothetical protein NZM37_06915 [Sandaracinaceae bacterium]|nr:hypothetical protein [Sandaracinaceae bacterium]MDW8247282.1 hypothetical protein [Sandaracinaceae bacterium]
MFREILSELINRSEGGIAAVVMGMDGIAVETCLHEGASLEAEQLGLELSLVLKEAQRASELLNAGVPKELTIEGTKFTAILRLINPDYFVALALKPEANQGKARYLLRVGALKLAQALE